MKSVISWWRGNWGIGLGFLYFGTFFSWSLNNIPYLDANLDFIKGVSFYTGGMKSLVTAFSSLHPLGKEILLALSFKSFGISAPAYNLIALPFFVVGLVSAKGLAEKIYDSAEAGNITAFLLATSPIFISVGVQAMTDFMVSCLVLYSLNMALERKLGQTLLGVCLALSIKETAMAILPAILFLYVTSHKNNLKTRIYQVSSLVFLPLFVFFSWKTFLESQGSSLWRVWVFGQAANMDVVTLILNNFLHFRIINPYFIENLKHLFFLNFNWIFWIAWGICWAVFGLKRQLPLLLFVFCYILLVLSFPTYSVPRYILPVLVVIYVGASGLVRIIDKKIVSILLILSFNLFSGFTSYDPISLKIWPAPEEFGRLWVFKQTLYNLNEKLSGNDRITYNLQSLMVSSERTKVIKAMNGEMIINSPDCLWLSRDPPHDLFTLHTLGIFMETKFPECNRRI